MEHASVTRLITVAPPPPRGPKRSRRVVRRPRDAPGARKRGRTAVAMPLPRCHTDCVEQRFSRLLRTLGFWVGSYPLPFLVVPLLLSGFLASGFYYLPPQDQNNLEEQFTPIGGPAKIDRLFVQAYFRTDDARDFSPERLSTPGRFATIILEAQQYDSLLTREAFAEILALDQAVRAISVQGLSFDDLCARRQNACMSPNPLVTGVQGNPVAIEMLAPQFTFPLHGGRLFLGYLLGGVTVGSGVDPAARQLLKARALRLIYFLQEDDRALRVYSELWLQDFLKRIPQMLLSMDLKKVKGVYFTSMSTQKEFECLAKDVIPLVAIAYVFTIMFSVVSCARMDCVRTKLWIGFFGVLSALLSVLSSFGLLLGCGMPFVITAANSPFLILGIGIDDMFILVSCWQHTKVTDPVKERMANTYAEASVSVTITTLTDILAFYIGMATEFPSIKSFCLYTGTAFIFCYIYNLTFLGAVLALNGKREESNRHWLTFMKVKQVPDESRSAMYNRCCVGGFVDESTGLEFEHPIAFFFRKYYGPFLVHKWTKIFVVVLYCFYLATSIYGCLQVKEGIDPRHVAVDDSYIIPYYNKDTEYFTDYGPRVMVIVTESVAYWNESVRAELENCMKTFEASYYIEKKFSGSWLRTYEHIAVTVSLNLNDYNIFMANLPGLFGVSPNSQWNINVTNNRIVASRFFIQTVNVKSSIDKKNLLKELRDIAAACKVPLMVYHPAFISYDQFLVIVQNTIQNVLIATGAMLMISLIFIPSPVCSLWVTFAIASVAVGVAGYMAHWKVSLDCISMVNLVISIGFSVDYSAHISYAFVSSSKPNGNEKAIDALHHLGYPILQASLSTFVGIIVLSMASTYVFRTCFKIMFLVITFGFAHGIVFIPVFSAIFHFRSAN